MSSLIEKQARWNVKFSLNVPLQNQNAISFCIIRGCQIFTFGLPTRLYSRPRINIVSSTIPEFKHNARPDLH